VTFKSEKLVVSIEYLKNVALWFLTEYFGDQIEKNEMGMACSTYGGEKRCIQDFDGET